MLLTDFGKNKEVDQILSRYCKSEWNTITKSLIVLGAKHLLSNYNVKAMTVKQIESIAYGTIPEEVSISNNTLSYHSMYFDIKV